MRHPRPGATVILTTSGVFALPPYGSIGEVIWSDFGRCAVKWATGQSTTMPEGWVREITALELLAMEADEGIYEQTGGTADEVA